MVISISNHFNLSRDYNQFCKQVPRLSPLNPNSINKGNRFKLPNSNKSNLNSVAPENSRLFMQPKNSLQQQANLQRVIIQNGNKLEVYTRGELRTQNQAKMRSELEAHSSQLVAGQVNGKKVYLNSEKDINPTVTENRNHQGQLAETHSQSLLTVDGKLKINPAAGHIDTSCAPNVVPGPIVVDLAANTGIRANFKLDNGSLLFDFSLVRMPTTKRVATAEEIVSEHDRLTTRGTQNIQFPGAANEIHFKGVIISSVDEEGNRVIELKGNITDQGIGELLANTQGFQTEEGRTEIDINGKLTVTRETLIEGDKTTSKPPSQAEMELNNVQEKEDTGPKITTVIPPNTTDGLRAGLIADHNALRFNYAIFILGISLMG